MSMAQELLTTDELSARIKYDVRTIRERLKDSVLIEGVHYIRPFGGRKISYLWDCIERDIGKASRARPIAIQWRTGAWSMGSVRVHTQKGTLFLDFRYQGKRCREYTALSNNATNVARLQRLLTKLEREIADGTFDYEATLSPCRAAAHERVLEPVVSAVGLRDAGPSLLCFQEFVRQWADEHAIECHSSVWSLHRLASAS